MNAVRNGGSASRARGIRRATLALLAVAQATLAASASALVPEVEPNGTAGTAMPLGAASARILGNISPVADVDYYSFAATSGDRVYAAVQTSSTTTASSDSVLDVIAADGTTVLESDDDNGTFSGTSSSIAGVTIPSNGTYYVRVRELGDNGLIHPYTLYVTVRSGSPSPETEPNNAPPGAALPAGGWVTGSLSSTADLDFYSINLAAGDTVFLSLDYDPERDATEWNGLLVLGQFGGTFLATGDNGGTGPDSEAHFMTVKTAGAYLVGVQQTVMANGFGTYHLSVAVHPAPSGQSCTTYTSTDVPQMIPDVDVTTSTLLVPGQPRIADLDVAIQLNHAFMQDVVVHLQSPAGNVNALFNDVGPSGAANMDLVLDDEAGLPIGTFNALTGMAYHPEAVYDLSWYDGESAGGTWTLHVEDNGLGDTGNLTGWSITVCEAPPPPPCGVEVTLLDAGFETDDAGFTHSGTADEWERGGPSFAPIATCATGASCWVTDLDGAYEANSSQDLLSPAFDLTGLVGPVRVEWAQRYQLQGAELDHAWVDVQQSGGGNATRLFEWRGATMTSVLGGFSNAQSAGWGVVTGDASAYLGLSDVQLRFHLDSDAATQLAGLGIDDVRVTACQSPGIDIDGDTQVQSLTDGLLALRRFFGLTDAALVGGALDLVNCTRCEGAPIVAHIAALGDQLDIDGNGEKGALTDGLLLIRWLFGLSGNALVSGVVDLVGCERCTAEEIEAYLEELDG